jgi:mono/diheme cytochrome c family protein
MRERFTTYTARNFFLALLLMCAAIAFIMPALSQEQAPKVKVEKVPARQTEAVSGSKLFHSYCATCHGQDGKGHGPAAPALKTAPTDLTLLAKNSGGTFPNLHVLHVLNSEQEYAAHGSKDMPIWGPIFRSMGANRDLGRLRAYNVTEYLKSIQAK